ncbi:MAG: GTPase Era [Anaerolineaceae bacterium]|nr:GTPase Era [Anaerolineaceae bacterium]
MENNNLNTEEKTFHSGFICVVGRPNVGKSSLINLLLGQKIAAVSPRPQTTQRVQLGILSDEDSQMIFMDTPGMHKPLSKLGEAMNEAAIDTISDGDCVLWIVDISVKPTAEDEISAERIKAGCPQERVVMVMNKADLVNLNQLAENENFYKKLLPEAKRMEISCRSGQGISELVKELKSRLPEGPAFYDPDQITDLYEREIAVDLIRESLLKNLDDEIPHSIAVRIEEYKDRTETNSYINATLLLDRESHKGIVIGKGGEMIKKISTDARREIERLTGRKIYLELRVKVMKNWRNDENLLRQLGIKNTDS